MGGVLMEGMIRVVFSGVGTLTLTLRKKKKVNNSFLFLLINETLYSQTPCHIVSFSVGHFVQVGPEQT